jgi:magnesium transporter
MANVVTEQLLTEIQDLIRERERDGVLGLAERIGPSEWADLVPRLEPREIAVLFQWLPDEEVAQVLEELSPSDAATILRTLTQPEAAALLAGMDPDDAADVVEELPTPEADQILIRMAPADAAEIRDLAAYPPESAGGKMTPAFVAVSRDARAAEAISAIRRLVDEAETVNYVYVIDAERHLLGVLSLYRLLLSAADAKVTDLMAPTTVRVRADADQEAAARLLTDRNLLAIPVVDDEDHLIGIITADDVADVLEDEATEDMYKMAGIGVKERATSPMLESARRRVPWLAFNMVWSLGSAVVISLFQGTIEQAAVLAIFIPVITGQAGNTGIQTATIVIRSLAIGDVSPRDTIRVLLREWGVGLIKGAIFGTALALIALIWQHNAALGLIAGLALAANTMIASTTGVVLPMTLRRLGIDPATIAGVFDTMVSDLMGNLIYLGLASMFIRFLI